MAVRKFVDPLADDFYLARHRLKLLGKEEKRPLWDPWPVDNFRSGSDVVFSAAREVLRQRNYQCIDNFIDRIILLPASSDPKSRLQGGSCGMWLYSIRSPSTLPAQIVLWMTPAGKIVVRRGNHSSSFRNFIAAWASKGTVAHHPCKHYDFWKSIKIDDRWLDSIPKHLHQQFRDRWWAVNGFRFLDLPFELREMIITFALGPIAEPYEYKPQDPLYKKSLPAPNIKLAVVNKQLQQEVLPVLFGHTKFRFSDNGKFWGFFYKHESMFKRIRFIELAQDKFRLLALFGVRMKTGQRSYGYKLFPTGHSKTFAYICTELPSLRRICIHIPCVNESSFSGRHNGCQELYCWAFWAGARECFRRIPTVDLQGYISDAQKRVLLKDLGDEERGIIPDTEELRNWQSEELTRWYVEKTA